MLRKRILAAGLITLAFNVGGAAAADLGSYSPSPEPSYTPQTGFTWTGPYVGGIIGYGWGNAKVNGHDADANGVTGGAYAGYNFSISNFLLGVEGDVTASGMEGKNGAVTVSNPWDATLRARAGFTMDRVLLYGTGGVAFGEVKAKNGATSDSNTETGWTAGVGAEAAITNNIIGRVEYRYTDLGSDSFATTPASKVDFTSNQVFAGVGFKF